MAGRWREEVVPFYFVTCLTAFCSLLLNLLTALFPPFLKGYIDDLRIYNYELSPSAIAAVAGNLREDVNGDGTVDIQDVLSIYDFIQSGKPVTDSTPQDANHDGIVDTQDVLCIYQYIQKQ